MRRQRSYGVRMRWEALFADMEAQLAAAQAAELAAQVADLTRAERATVDLTSRLRAAQGAQVTVRVGTAESVPGTVLEVAPQWLLLGDGPRRALVPLTALSAVGGLPVAAVAAHGAAHGMVARRLGLGHALRALARDRTVVRVAVDGAELVGRLDRVGADHVDVTTVTADAAARRSPARAAGHGSAAWTVPLAAIRVVRSG